MQILYTTIVVVVAVVFFAVLIRWVEKHIVFFPSRFPEGNWNPQSVGVEVREVFFSAGNLPLHGWHLTHPRPVAQILMCHGNAGNIAGRLDLLQSMQAHLAADIFIFDYRGFGRSGGAPTEDGVYEDAIAAFDWLRNAAPDLPVIVHGHSLGTAVAVELATRRRDVEGLILESPFTSGRDMARQMFGALPMHWIASMRWASDEKIADLHMPKLFLHGDRDTTVPLSLGQALYESAPPPKEIVIIPQAGHNDLYLVDSERYFGAISRFLEECAQPQKAHHEMNAAGR